METTKCKICRRLGNKLFLKGERCMSPKCAFVRRPYPPGNKGKGRGRRNVSEYKKELEEKQKMRNWYNLRERQFSKYVKQVLEKRGKVEDAGVALIKQIAARLDNVVCSLGFAASRPKAKQLVSHGHFLVNGKRSDIPSYRIKKGDVISVRPDSRKKEAFKNMAETLKKIKSPAWAQLNAEKLEAKITAEPTFDQSVLPAEIHAIFEYYSK